MEAWQIVAAAAAFALLVGIYRRRQNLRHNLRALILSASAGAIVYVLAHENGWPDDKSLFSAVAVGALLFALWPRRSRHIPARVKRQMIARYERETRRTFNPRTDELDHDVPFSKGGSHSEDNLRVVPRKKNRSKGDRAPWWDLLGW